MKRYFELINSHNPKHLKNTLIRLKLLDLRGLLNELVGWPSTVEGGRLLTCYTGLNLYRGFKSLPTAS